MDPFGDVLADAERQLASAQLLLRQYQSSPVHDKLMDLNNIMQELTETIHDLSQSISAVQQQPETFGVNQLEINRRIEQVGHINNQVTDIQEALANIKHTQPDIGPPSSGGTGFVDESLGGNDEVDDPVARQAMIQEAMREQDGVLDSVYDTVSNLREQANVMTQELEDQAFMLDDFDRDADTAGDRLQRGLKRIDWVLKNNRDTMSSCCIMLLIIVLIVLLVLVVIA